MGKGHFINELVALAEGAKSLCKETDLTILDIGSRDMKLVTFKSGRFDKCDWNTSCGAMVGFTIELIMKYFNKTPADLRVTDRHFDITCGLLGITKFFDQDIKGFFHRGRHLVSNKRHGKVLLAVSKKESPRSFIFLADFLKIWYWWKA